MDFKKKLEHVTMDKRELQKRSIQLKKSLDEVKKVIGTGKSKRKGK